MAFIYRPELKDAVVHGYGMVGRATARALNIKHWQDPNGGNTTLEEAAQYHYQFICIPTYNLPNGLYDLAGMYNILVAIAGQGCTNHVFIIRSTVLPGTCSSLARYLRVGPIVHVPEFLTESDWERDTDFPDQIVVGCDNPPTRAEMVMLYHNYYHSYDNVPIMPTDTVTAELIKCAHNAFFSTKVIFANEMYELAQRVGADYDTIRDALYRSKWIGGNHFDAVFQRPSWDKPRRGLHGKCLPKDLRALLAWSDSDLLEVVDLLNERYIKMGSGEEE